MEEKMKILPEMLDDALNFIFIKVNIVRIGFTTSRQPHSPTHMIAFVGAIIVNRLSVYSPE